MTEEAAGRGRRRVGFWVGAALAAALMVIPLPGLAPEARRTAAVALLMALWWMTEALPLAVTALVPLVLFPVLGLRSPGEAATPYANPVVFLFLGGFVLALAMERWHLHRRVALAIVAAVGTKPQSLVLGFMLATAFVSMWVSNTATAAMMTPIAIAIAELLRPDDHNEPFPFGTALLLGVAYAATIGGIATLIGTPPNAVFAAAARELLGRSVTVTEWLLIGLPFALIMLPIAWALLVFVLYRPGPLGAGAAEALAEQRHSLGPMSRGESTTATVFALMVLGWLLREPKVLGAVTIPGIATFAPGIDDSTIAIAGALALFLLPTDRQGTRVLDWGATRDLPWGVLLLFGGGLSLAAAFESSGLTAAIGRGVAGLGGLPPVLLLAIVAAVFVYLSELASNTAIAAMAMPLLAAAAAGIDMRPVVLMATGAIASSAAFMLPVGTPPNAIVFGSGYISMREMVRAGFLLNLVSIALTVVLALLAIPRVLG